MDSATRSEFMPAPSSLALLPSMLHYRNQQLYCEDSALAEIVRQQGTPTYVYSQSCIQQAYTHYARAFTAENALICYAVKANSNLAVLSLLAKLGAGFDIVSSGELVRVLAAGGTPDKIVFSGVGKTVAEIQQALAEGIQCFNIESVAELELTSRIAHSMGKKAPVSIRVNPNVDAQTHPYIATGLQENKFGIAATDVVAVYQYAQQLPGIALHGIDCHIGSQIMNVQVYADAVRAVAHIIQQIKALNIHLRHINFGGGLGIAYDQETQPASPQQLRDVIVHTLAEALPDYRKYQLICEPGRSLVGNAGVLLTKVLFTKKTVDKTFVIVDAAMNDLLRPSLYQATHRIVPLKKTEQAAQRFYDVVGPVCETGDYLAKNIALSPVQAGDVLAVLSTGAYGFVMASNYNSRPRAAEIMVSGADHAVVRTREQVTDLMRGESMMMPDV